MFPMCFDFLRSWAFFGICLRLVRDNIPAAGAVDRELCFCCLCVFYSGFEVPDVLQKLLGGRGFVLTEYEPLGGHGDPLHAHLYKFGTPIVCPSCLILKQIGSKYIRCFCSKRLIFVFIYCCRTNYFYSAFFEHPSCTKCNI